MKINLNNRHAHQQPGREAEIFDSRYKQQHHKHHHQNQHDVVEYSNHAPVSRIHRAQTLHFGFVTSEKEFEELQQGIENIYGQKNFQNQRTHRGIRSTAQNRRQALSFPPESLAPGMFVSLTSPASKSRYSHSNSSATTHIRHSRSSHSANLHPFAPKLSAAARC